jgi:hypothetical protein
MTPRAAPWRAISGCPPRATCGTCSARSGGTAPGGPDWEAVELSPVVGKYLWDAAGDPARLVDREEEAAAPLVPPGLTDRDLAVLALLRDGERKTAAYARVLGIADRPIEEQRRIVKREKDRLQKRLARAAQPPRATGVSDE